MRVTDLMREYFERDIAGEQHIPDNASLVRPIASENELERLSSPDRLRKAYVFDDPRKAVAFVTDLVEHEISSGHHAKITLEESKVTIEVRTYDTDGVTDLDYEYIEYADLVQSDFDGDWNTKTELRNVAIEGIRRQRLLGFGRR